MTNRTVGLGLVSLACLALGAVACGGSGGPVAMDDVPARYSEALCGKVYECCTPVQLMGNMFTGTDQKSCQVQMAGLLQLSVSQWKKSEMAGRIVYHGDKAGACIDAFKAATCTQLNAGMDPTSADPNCRSTIEPKVALAGACSQTEECIGGTCEGAVTSPPKDGVCKPFASSGASCSDASCADGTWCDNAGGSPTCKVTKADGLSCNSSNECMSGGCNGGDSSMGMPGTCGGKVAPGQCFASGCAVTPARPSLLSGLCAVAMVGLALLRARRSRHGRRP